jgi:hypothetical protein
VSQVSSRANRRLALFLNEAVRRFQADLGNTGRKLGSWSKMKVRLQRGTAKD